MKTPTAWSKPAKTAVLWSSIGRFLAAWVVVNATGRQGYLYNDASRNYDDATYQYDYVLAGANSLNTAVPTSWSST